MSFSRNLVCLSTILNKQDSVQFLSISLQTGIRMQKGNYYVYITTNPCKTVLYTGVTNDLRRGLFEHYNNRGKKNNFAGKYYYKLIYYEHFVDINQVIEREKRNKV